MKMQMEIKTDGRSLFDDERIDAWSQADRKKNKQTAGLIGLKRWGMCALLIGVLAASGFAGAGTLDARQTAAAPVISRSGGKATGESLTYDEIRMEHEKQRERELAILNEVISDASADNETKEQANEQKTEIVKRLENEAAIQAALAHMGYGQAAVVCAQERVVLIMPSGMDIKADTVRMIDAVCSVSGCEAKDVKIILAKK